MGNAAKSVSIQTKRPLNALNLCYIRPMYNAGWPSWHSVDSTSNASLPDAWSQGQGRGSVTNGLLNERKTEALLVATSSSDKDLPTSIQISSSVVPFVKSVRDLDVILDSRLSMKEHINKVCQMAYWELRRISLIRQYRAWQRIQPKP